jgi:hypothetical protein
MGKAVTRRRTDLIAYINKDGIRPPHFDKEIWDRLEMLAGSQQRRKKTEHGRYVNSCRRTLGRTGASGEEGVRERLCELLGRSPDPDKVAEEMQRDKGYGKRKYGSLSFGKLSEQEHCHDLIAEDEPNNQTLNTGFQQFNSDEEGRQIQKSFLRPLNRVSLAYCHCIVNITPSLHSEVEFVCVNSKVHIIMSLHMEAEKL